jgi:hypothetical protein
MKITGLFVILALTAVVLSTRVDSGNELITNDASLLNNSPARTR